MSVYDVLNIVQNHFSEITHSVVCSQQECKVGLLGISRSKKPQWVIETNPI